MNQVAIEKLYTWMRSEGFDRFFVYRPENLAWLSGGGVATVEVGVAVAWLELGDNLRLHTSRIEAARLSEEEFKGVLLSVHPWYALPPHEEPNDLDHDLTPLRLILSPAEQNRFRALGADCAWALETAMHQAQPDWSERALAGAVSELLEVRGIQPVVLLVGGEERVLRFRHPLPKSKPLGRLTMGIVCGERGGLVASLTRIKHWSHPEAPGLYPQVLQVEAAALAASRPGVRLSEVLEVISHAYREVGEGGAIEDHHQGGLAGYRTREVLAVPTSSEELAWGMAVAWNPSLPGVKVEDTFLLAEPGLENLTAGHTGWPVILVEGRARPGLLEG